MKTFNAKPGETEMKWWIVDATDQTLGRLATRIATLIRGKHKPQFTPHVDTGDFVVVINSDKVKLTGTKLTDRKYYSRSRFFGSLKSLSAEQLLEKQPARMVELAVQGMLPKNKLSRRLIRKLKAYPGADHPHTAQKPEALTISK